MNMLQFIFLSLRLDGFTSWSWEVVFVPLWIVLCLSLVGVLYTIIFAGILLRTPQVNAEQRRSWFNSALAYTFLVVPILVFQVSLFYTFNIICGVLTKYGGLPEFHSGHPGLNFSRSTLERSSGTFFDTGVEKTLDVIVICRNH